VSAKFYGNQKVDIVEDSLRAAVASYGNPDAIYVDYTEEKTKPNKFTNAA